MKIYTEVNYQLNNGELEQVSSESFDYSGLILQCGGATKVIKKVVEPVAAVAETVTTTATDTINKATGIVSDAASSAGEAATTNISNLGTGSGGTLGQISEGVSNVGTQLGTAVTTGINKGTQNLTFALDKTVGAVGLAAAKGIGKLLGTYSDSEGGGDGDTSSAVPKRDAPGASESIGAGGQSGMKSASMSAVKKRTAGSGGKRRLRKVSRSGAKV